MIVQVEAMVKKSESTSPVTGTPLAVSRAPQLLVLDKLPVRSWIRRAYVDRARLGAHRPCLQTR